MQENKENKEKKEIIETYNSDIKIQIENSKNLNSKFSVNQLVWTDFGYAKIKEFQNKEQEINLQNFLKKEKEDQKSNSNLKENQNQQSQSQKNQQQEQQNLNQQQQNLNSNSNSNEQQSQIYSTEGQKVLSQIVTLSSQSEPACSLHVPLKNLSQTITVKVKTFFGARSRYVLQNLPINDLKIAQIKQKILQQSGQDERLFYNKRLIYPMAQINNLEDGSTLSENKIPNNAQLIFLVQQSFYWDVQMKGAGLLLSNNNLTVKKPAETNYQIILGNLPLRAGKTYFEIKIENLTQIEEEGDDILIGLARKDIDLNIPYSEQRRNRAKKRLQKKGRNDSWSENENQNENNEINENNEDNLNNENNLDNNQGNSEENQDSGMIWGYLPLRAEKVGPDFNYQPYGNRCRKGDTVGVLFEFKSGLGTLSFYKNKEKFDLAFNNLTGVFYPAVSLPYGEFQITLDPKAQPPV